jgi:hypothetical protein
MKSGQAEVPGGDSEHCQPVGDLHRIITEHQQARSLQAQVPHLPRRHRLLGRHGTPLEARLLIAQNRPQRVSRPPHRGQHEPHQAQEENA